MSKRRRVAQSGQRSADLPVPDESSGGLNESTRRIEEALERYRSPNSIRACEAGDPRYQDLFDVSIKIGMSRSSKQVPGCAGRLSNGLGGRRPGRADQRVVDWKVKLAVALEQAGDGLYHLAGPAGGDPAFIKSA